MKKAIWIVCSCLMALSLIIASCGPSEPTTPTTPTTPTSPTTPTTPTTPTEPVESTAPKYGGTVTVVAASDPRGFDDVYGWNAQNFTLKMTHEELTTGDWSRGPVGTGEFDWAIESIIRMDTKTGALAESWEIPEEGVIIFNIRHGVHFAVNPESEASSLVNGREINAEDIAAMLNHLISNPRATLSRTPARNATITTPDKWTIHVDFPIASFAEAAMLADYAISGYPKEVVDTYGLPLDWNEAVGTGPFMLMDYVPGSAATLARNPDYWMKDPVGAGKGNQLPYVDNVKLLIISDLSTRLAAIRTAKVDIAHNIEWEDAGFLNQTSKDLKSKEFLIGDGFNAIMMRIDKPELPFDEIKVRQAMMMATDFETIKEDYCGGNAIILSWPISYTKEYADCYLPLEEAPESVQELYTYNPDRAVQLLADAGYPEGFKTKIVTSNSPSSYIDYLSIIADQWSKVGIELEIEPVELGVLTSISLGRTFDELEYGPTGVTGNAFLGSSISTGTSSNGSYIDDATVNEALAIIGPMSMSNPAEAARLHKELMPYVLEQAWVIPTPATPRYHFWWPWVKNYHGEYSIGRNNSYNYTTYVWIDEELKESMGY